MTLTRILSCALVFLSAATSALAQQANPNFLREFTLVPLPFAASDNLVGSLVKDGRLIQPSSVKPEIITDDSIRDVVFQKDSGSGINAGATIFDFINARTKVGRAKFKVTELGQLKVVRAIDIPELLKNQGMNQGTSITAYLVSDEFTFCSDKVSEIIIQAQLTGGSAGTPGADEVKRDCKTFSDQSLAAIKRGEMGIKMPEGTREVPLPAQDEVRRKISDLVAETFDKIGLKNVGVSVDLRSHSVTVATANKPMVVGWQLVKYDPRKVSKVTRVEGDFAASNLSILNDPTVANTFKGGLPSYRVETGVWDTAFLSANNQIHPRCIFLRVTDVTAEQGLQPATYCPQTTEFDTRTPAPTGYVRHPSHQYSVFSLKSFVRKGVIVKPTMTISLPVIYYDAVNGLKMTAKIRIDEQTSPYSFVKK